MKKIFLLAILLASTMSSRLVNAQWTNVPGITANKIYCASATQVVATSGSQTALDNVSKLNTTNNTWVSQGNGSNNMREVGITSSGTIWGISSSGVFSKTTTGSFVNSNFPSTTLGTPQKIAMRGSSLIVTASSINTVAVNNGASWVSYPGSISSPTEIAAASDGTLMAVGNTTAGVGNLYLYNFTGQWFQIQGNMPNGKLAVRNATQVLARGGIGDLYVRFGNGWVFLRSGIQDLSIADDGTIYIVTTAATNNVFKSTWDLLACPALLPPTIIGETNICGAGNTTTLSLANGVTGINYLWSNNATTTSITVGTAGNYSIRAIANGCTSAVSEPVTITVNPRPIAPTITGPASLCPNTNATLSVPLVAGVSYLWEDNSTAVNRTINNPGTYSIRAISNGCTSAAPSSITVASAAPTTPTISGNASVCSGSSITLSVSNPVTGATYVWSNGTVGNSLSITPTTGASPSTLNYTVQGVANGCSSSVSIVKTITVEPILVTPSIAGASSICLPNGGTTTLNVANPIAGYSYEWHSGGINIGIGTSLLVNGARVVSVKAVGACPSAFSAAVTVNATPNAPQINSSGVSVCAGNAATLTIFQPAANTTYLWSDGQTGNTITISPTVNTPYTARAISNGCTSAVSTPVTATVTGGPTAPTITGVASICGSGNTTLSVASPAANTTYLWSNGTTANSITVSASGNFTVRAISNGCTSAVSTPIAVTVTPLPNAPSIVGTASFCAGGNTTLSVANPQANTTYLWSIINNGAAATGNSITASVGGAYSVRAISNACTSAFAQTVMVTVNPVPATPIIAAVGSNSFCVGGNATLGIASVGANVTYLWSNGATGSQITVSAAGNYTVRAIANGCTSAVSQAITITATPTPATPSISGVGSYCPFSGGATLSVTSPAANTTYLWSNGAMGNSITAFIVDNYTVRAISNGCTSAVSQAVAVTISSLPNEPSITGINSFCAGGSTTLSIASPAANTTYLWNNGATGNSITVSAAGNFTVRAISAAGCTSSTSLPIAVTVKAVPTTPSISGTASFCAGGNTTLSVVNPAANTTYLWSNGTTGNSITVSAAGSFTVRAISPLSCTSAVSPAVAITVNAAPTTPSISGTNSFCTGGNTTLSVASPAANTTYLWSNGTTANSITVSAAGSFTVRAISNGCTSSVSPATAVTVNALPAIPNISGTNSFCTGGNTTLSVASPAANTTYLWSNGTTANSITVSAAGNFTVRAISAAGCTSSVSPATAVTVNALPTTPSISGANSFCTGDNTTLSVASPAVNTTYLWSNGTTANSITVSAAGSFTVRAISAAGCTSSVSPATAVTVNALPATPSISVAGNNTCAVTLSATGGASYIWSLGSVVQSATSASFTPSVSGSYTVRAVNAAGCTSAVSQAAAVTVVSTLAAPSISAVGATTFCAGGSAVLNATGAPAGAIYTWSNGSTGASITVSTSGTYTASYASAGCNSAASSSIVVTVNELPTAPTITGITSICGNGTTTLSVASPAANTTYLWSNGTTANSITVSAAGNFTVRAISAAGCTSAVSPATAVTVNVLPATPSISGTNSFCTGGNTTLSVASPAANTTYLWSNGTTANSITVSAADNFTVRAISAAGCTSSVSPATAVTVNAVPTTPSISGANSFCTGDNTTLSVASPAVNTTYLWSNGTTANSITVSAAGSFTVRAISAAGCTSSVSPATAVTVNALPATPSISVAGNNTCAVTLSATGGASYIWSLGSVVQSATSASFTPSVSGSYTVRAVNAAGCTSAVSQAAAVTVVSTLAAPSISAVGATTFCAGGSAVLNATGAPAGAIYTWSNGSTGASITVSTSGTYTASYASAGCNSVASSSIVVTVNELPMAMISQNGNVLSAMEVPNASYQWLLSGQPIANATSANYTATVDGNYTVRVTLNGCSATSDVISVVVISIANKLNAVVKLYPNPSTGIVNLEVSDLAKEQMTYSVTNALGQEVSSGNISEEKMSLSLPQGFFFVKIQSREGMLVKQIVVQ